MGAAAAAATVCSSHKCIMDSQDVSQVTINGVILIMSMGLAYP
jgi:hypothetical protein